MTSIVILSKTVENLVPCVRAIREMEAGNGPRIIVVDDGVAKTDLGLPGVHWVPGTKPFIFARNANLGIRAAAGGDVILLNDDALLKTWRGFTAMADFASAHPEYGVVAATSNSVGNPAQQPHNIGLRDEPRMVCFVCVFLPRRTIDQVGLLDERFVGYGMDDDDYCLRVRQAGLKLGIWDGCFVDHLSLKSSYRGLAGAGGDFSGNLALFRQKWGHDNWGRA